jgi:hypothetical protein
MYYPAERRLTAKIQAPLVQAEIRALRGSIFKSSPEVQRALAIAEKIEQRYDLSRTDLFLPALETCCAILEPFAMTVLTGTMRRVGYEMFPQYVSILGTVEADPAGRLDSAIELVPWICRAWAQCVTGSDAGALTAELSGSKAIVTDSTFLPCQLQIGVLLGAGKATGLYREAALVEKACRSKGDSVCVYELAL